MSKARYGVGQVTGCPASREGTRAVAERVARVMRDSPYEEVHLSKLLLTRLASLKG
jgi:hypothetical protein